MGFSYRILSGPPQTGRVIFAADWRSVALAAIFAAVDKKTTAADAAGEISDRPFRFGTGIPGKRFAGVCLGNQGAFQPARRNIKNSPRCWALFFACALWPSAARACNRRAVAGARRGARRGQDFCLGLPRL